MLIAYKILDEKGNVKRIVGTHTDLTELNALKNLLEENETKYKSLFDQSKKNVTGKVHFNDFLDVLFRLEERLIKKLNDSTTRMISVRKNRDEFRQKMNQAIQYENVNQDGFGEGILILKVNSFHAKKEISGFHEFSIYFKSQDYSYATARKPFSNEILIDESIEMY